MGWNFRKSVKVFPGFKLNFSKSGISGTVGIRGASVTVGPKGVYANASIPGTGIYKRQKISGRETSSKDNSNYLLNTDLNSKKFYITTYPLIFGDSIRMPVLRPTYYIPYILSLVLPIVALFLGLVFRFSWWILPINIIQLLCWWYCYKTVNWYFYGYEWYTGKLELEYKANQVIKSHWKRFVLALSIILLNFIIFCFCFFYMVTELDVSSSFVFFIFLCVCIFMFFAWYPLASDDKYFAKEWDELIIPVNEKADKNRNFDNNLKFNNIIIGDYAKNYFSGGWVKVDEFDDYQVYFVQKDIVVHEVNLKCDCFIHCIGEKIGFVEVTHFLEKENTVENEQTQKEIVKNIYSLFVTKYGLPKEKKVKYFNFRFTRTWNFLNQRVVFQHRMFEERTEESYLGVVHQVKINYVDNKLYKSMKDLWRIEYQKRIHDQMVKKEVQKLEAEEEEKRRKEQLQIDSEQI